MKTCPKCKNELPIDQFYKDKRTKDGYKNWCKACANASTAAWRGKDPEPHRKSSRNYYRRNREKLLPQMRERYLHNAEERQEYAREYRKANPTRYMLTGARTRAKALGLEFNLEESDITIPETCPVLGMPLVFGRLTRNDNSPSLDRIDNTKGYVKGNVVVISMRANRLKNNGTLEELEALVAFYRKLAA